MKPKKHIVILGAGPAGLGAAWRLTDLGYNDFTVYERQEYVGGLAASFTDEQGFTWDIGGHVLHSHFPYFDAVFKKVMRGAYVTHRRESWVWIADRFVPYPLQNNIHRLPETMRDDCLDGLRKRTPLPPNKHDFSSWITATYGDGIAAHFMVPYNRKVWAYPLQDMGCRWVADRVAPVDLVSIEKNMKAGRDDAGWGPNAVFHYPKNGGTGDIWKRVAKRFASHIRGKKEAVRVDVKKKRVYFSDGTTEPYDLLFSSVPLDQLTRLTTGDPTVKKTTALHHSGVTIVGLGMKGEVPQVLQKKCWMYFADPKIPFFRATVLSNYSSHNAPKGCWSLMCEISFSATMPMPEGDVAERVLHAAKQIGLIPVDATVIDRFVHTTSYGYPTPTIERDGIVDPLLIRLEKSDIYSRGRFGMWKYEISNQDHTFMQGVEWADRMLSGKKESLLKSVGK